MARISRFKLEDDVLEKLFTLFFQVVGKKSSKDEFQKTIVDLLSPVERVMIAKRIAIAYLLLKKIDYLTICETLKVSSATVAKFSLLLEKSEGLIPTFKTLLRNEKITQFLEELFVSLHMSPVVGTDWSSGRRVKNIIERRKARGI